MNRDVILGCAVDMRRDISGVPFPAKMSAEDRLELAGSEEFDDLIGEFGLRVGAPGYPDADMLIAEKTMWHGREIEPEMTYTGTGGILLMMNAGDHFAFRARRLDDDIAKAFDDCSLLEERLGRAFSFAMDENLGYLTAFTEDTGNAMHAQALLHLPALSELEKIDDTKKQLEKEGFELIQLVDIENGACAFYCLQSVRTLGRTCREITDITKEEMKALETAERTCRDSLVNDDPDDYADKVLRSLGVLENARLLAYDEFVDLYSDVRMGLTGGLLNGDVDEMDMFAADMSPRGILKQHGEVGDRDDLLYRAAAVRAKLAQAVTRRDME